MTCALALIVGMAFTPEGGNTQKFIIDTNGSTMEWVGGKEGHQHMGAISLSGGYLELKKGKPVGGQINVDMSTIISTDDAGEKLVSHLNNEDFFNVKRFPTASFEIKKMENVEGENYNAIGSLTIMDIAVDATIPVTLRIKEDAMEASGTFTLDRSLHGQTYGLEKIGKDIELTFKIAGNLAK